tara:strand:+ start:34 stop:1809 length:1776 start_codon:yes stop_codon:yes gene_type:complete
MADPEPNGILAALGIPNAFQGTPFGLEPAETNLGAFGLGMLELPSAVWENLTSVGDSMIAAPPAVLDYLEAPTEFGVNVEKNKISSEKFGDIEMGMDSPKSLLGEFGGTPTEFGGTPTETESEIDKIAATLAEAQTPSFFNAGDAMAAGQAGAATDSPILTKGKVTQKQADEGFLSAMDDFFEASRGAGPEMPEKRTIEEYKKVFSEATGIDTSGEVDKSDALMAFGLALMQNKAGKGFNVSKMLTATGKAGDKAMPVLQKAKDRARQGALAGGKYALQTQSADKATRAANEEKMMNRSSYYVYENDPEGKPYGRFSRGKTVELNKYELNELVNDPDFDSKYSFISGSQYGEVLKEKNKSPEYGDEWDPNKPISLIGDPDGPAIFNVSAARRSSNYKGPRDGNSLQLAEDPNITYRRIVKEQEKINKQADSFNEAISQIQGGISIPSQIGSSVTMGLRNLGFKLGTGTTGIQQVKNFLKRTQALNASNILGEAGKTLSDNDRRLVSDIVGTIDFKVATEEELLEKLSYVYETVITRAQSNIDTALNTLETEAGVIMPKSNNSGKSAITEEEVVEYNKMFGTNYTIKTFPKD